MTVDWILVYMFIERGVLCKVDILRQRNKGESPCDEDMKDEDEYIMKQLIRNVGCIPTYLERFANERELHHTTLMCTNTTDYQKVRHEFRKAVESSEKQNSNYKQPCKKMITSMAVRDERLQNNMEILQLTISYHQSLYRQIKNTEAYSSETLLGQVGGFVGM